MALSYHDAIAQITAPGQFYETETITVGDVDVTAFKNAPGSVRDLLSLARLRPDETFLVYEDERLTFGEVMARVDALGAALVERFGIGKGDRVAIAMRNYPEWVIAFGAITSVGAVLVSLNAWWTADELDFAIGDSTPKVLIADEQRLERAQDSCARHGTSIIAVRTDTVGPGIARWDDVVVPGPSLPAVDIQPDDDVTILYTSGTTGTAKGAVSTNRAVVQALLGFGCRKAVEDLREPFPADPSGPPTQAAFILVVPLFHVTGMVAVMLSSFVVGSKLVMLYRWDAERALQLVERERVTQFVGVPTQSWDMVNSPAFARYDTSSLRSIAGGGAPAPPELVNKVEDSFPAGRPAIGYGLTETNAYGPQNSGTDYTNHPTSAGRGTPILEVAIRDGADQDLPKGEIGEICFRGPHLVRGYWNRPDETASTFINGWLHTGDLGRLDEDGFVYIVDRAKDMVLRGGENVYCAEVEAAFFEHPAVYEVAVYGLPDERLGESVAATVHLRPGSTANEAELQAFVGERLAAFKVPERITFAQQPLPRNAAGKIVKRQLRDMAAT